MAETILYIDGENLRHYIEEVLVNEGIPKKDVNITKIDFKQLFNEALKGLKIDKKIYYSARLHFDKRTPKKSRELIKRQRILKTNLEKCGYEFLISGHVRAREITVKGKKRLIFNEKGVDVKMAVDLVAAACDKNISTAIICTSDSDFQPAITEIKKKRGIETIYLGFEMRPNKGLSYTNNRTILLRNSEVMAAYK